jgi:hypothetical protein
LVAVLSVWCAIQGEYGSLHTIMELLQKERERERESSPESYTKQTTQLPTGPIFTSIFTS